MRQLPSPILALIAAACFAGAGRLTGPLAAHRRATGLSNDDLRHAPPAVVFTTIALGGFRGLLADALWIRASQLQDAGDYVELVQLSDWITRLDPRNTEVWEFHAWNMAYNVSVMMPDIDDRWRWVQNGIRLLRDEGLLINPDAASMYRALGWLYQHKIGSPMDTAHHVYKVRLAADMMRLLGSGHPDMARLRADSLRCTMMEQQFKLLPDVMDEIHAAFGPLDWRIPETHAVYWAWRGLKHARGDEGVFCHRMILQCLSELVRSGKLDFDEAAGRYVRTPWFALLPRVLARFEEVLQQYPIETFEAGRQTLLTDVTRLYHAAGMEADARRYFEQFNAHLPPPLQFSTYEAFVATRPGTYYVEPPGPRAEGQASP